MKLSRFWDPLGLFQPPKTTPMFPGDFSAQTATEGTVIGVLFGTADIKSTNITYWGDVKSVAIKKKNKK